MNAFPLLVLSLWLNAVFDCQALLKGEQGIIEKCLANYGGPTPENIQRLERFKEWSLQNEEVPCFTQCYLGEMFGIYDQETGFDEDAVAKNFGQAVYSACRERLAPDEGYFKSSCEHAFAGFHCIVSLENDPFIMIEKLPNATDGAKSAMKECLLKVDQSERIHLDAYAKFPVNEPIPCYTRCFILQLRLFDERTRRWQLPAMRRELGVPLVGAHVNGCNQRRGRNPCSTIYQQFTCYVMAN